MSGGLAQRLYRGEAGINVVGKRRMWMGIAGILLLVAIAGMFIRGFHLGIEFEGGNKFTIPASVGSLADVERSFGEQEGVEVKTAQVVGGGANASYEIRTTKLDTEEAVKVKTAIAEEYNLAVERISDDTVSTSWGE